MSPEAEKALRAAGWQPGRSIDTTSWRLQLEQVGLQMHDAAEAFLREFGGLDFEYGGPGISRAREPFHLDPALAVGDEDRLEDWGPSAGRHLFPIGYPDDRYLLSIDQFSEIYCVDPWDASFGRMPEALENLVLGVAPTEIDAPDRS